MEKYHSLHLTYYDSLGKAEPGEPVLVVRISTDGESRFLKQAAEKLTISLRDQYGEGDVTIMELPEDEFYFFQAFRPGLFNLDKELPAFILQMALVYAHTLFETYIADIVRLRLHAHPAQVGLKKQVTVGDVLAFATREELLTDVIENEVQQIMHRPIGAVLELLRNRLGLRNLPATHDEELALLSLKRNCFVHNAGKADEKLASADPGLVLGQPIVIDTDRLTKWIGTYRKFCASVDREFESVTRSQSA